MYSFYNIRSSSTIRTEEIWRAKAIHITKKLKQENFDGSNGLLKRFTKRFNIKSRLLYGERSNVDMNMVMGTNNQKIESLLGLGKIHKCIFRYIL